MKVIIIDSDSILYLVCHNKKDEPEKSLAECKTKVDEFLLDIFGKTYSTHYLMYLTEGKSFRYSIYPEYKANRIGKEKPKYFNEVKQYLKDKYKAISFPELEADDLCVISMKFIDSKDIVTRLTGSTDCFIAALDKDLLNLEGEHYNYKTGEWKYTTKDEADLYFWSSLIIGKLLPNRVKFGEALILS